MPTKVANVGTVHSNPKRKQYFCLLTHENSFSIFVTECSDGRTDGNTYCASRKGEDAKQNLTNNVIFYINSYLFNCYIFVRSPTFFKYHNILPQQQWQNLTNSKKYMKMCQGQLATSSTVDPQLSYEQNKKTDESMTHQDGINSFCTYFSVEPMGYSDTNTICKIKFFVLFSKRKFKILLDL